MLVILELELSYLRNKRMEVKKLLHMPVDYWVNMRNVTVSPDENY